MPEAAAGGKRVLRGEGGHSGRVRAEDRTAQGRKRGKHIGRPRFLSSCVGACGTRADAGEAGRPPDVSAVVLGSRGARTEAADECGRGIVRREGGHGEG